MEWDEMCTSCHRGAETHRTKKMLEMGWEKAADKDSLEIHHPES